MRLKLLVDHKPYKLGSSVIFIPNSINEIFQNELDSILFTSKLLSSFLKIDRYQSDSIFVGDEYCVKFWKNPYSFQLKMSTDNKRRLKEIAIVSFSEDCSNYIKDTLKKIKRDYHYQPQYYFGISIDNEEKVVLILELLKNLI